MESKKDIRKQILAVRSALTTSEWIQKSRAICDKVMKHPLFLEATTVYCYVDYRNEVGTRDLIESCWKLGKCVAVPKVLGDVMEFYYIHDFSELQEGYRGILEPEEREVALNEQALIIMPGAAFDSKRNRIGYGKGYYDKYLELHPNCRTLALAFACQMVAEVPSEACDIRPEVLVTEEGIYENEFAK